MEDDFNHSIMVVCVSYFLDVLSIQDYKYDYHYESYWYDYIPFIRYVQN